MKMRNLSDLCLYLEKGNKMENIKPNDYNMSCELESINNDVYEDDNLQEFFTDLNISIVEIDIDKFILSDGITTVFIPYVNYRNRFEDTYPDETVLLFDKIKIK